MSPHRPGVTQGPRRPAARQRGRARHALTGACAARLFALRGSGGPLSAGARIDLLLGTYRSVAGPCRTGATRAADPTGRWGRRDCLLNGFSKMLAPRQPEVKGCRSDDRKLAAGNGAGEPACHASAMPPQRATLLQVAQRAGVSRSTASFVLAGRHVDMRISEDARQRVLRAAQELDYRPNLMARSLRTKVTKTIALVSDTLASDPYAGRAIHGGLAAAVAHGHLLFIGETEGDAVVEEKLISDFLDRQVDAFVYASMFPRHVRVPKLLKGHPVVLLNCLTRTARPAYHSIIPDEVAAGWSAAKVVIEAGHRDGIHIVGNPAHHVFA